MHGRLTVDIVFQKPKYSKYGYWLTVLKENYLNRENKRAKEVGSYCEGQRSLSKMYSMSENL